MYNVYRRDDLLSQRAFTDARDRKHQKEITTQKSTFDSYCLLITCCGWV
jgi:hypothetical protein